MSQIRCQIDQRPNHVTCIIEQSSQNVLSPSSTYSRTYSRRGGSVVVFVDPADIDERNTQFPIHWIVKGKDC